MNDNKAVFSKFLKNGYEEGRYKSQEVVIALVAMVEDGKISKEDIKDILYQVFDGNVAEMYKALNVARQIIDEEMIKEILTN